MYFNDSFIDVHWIVLLFLQNRNQVLLISEQGDEGGMISELGCEFMDDEPFKEYKEWKNRGLCIGTVIKSKLIGWFWR